MNKLIYIAVEGKSRELIAKCLLAAVFLNRGFCVVLGNHSIIRRMAAQGTSGVLIDKDFSEIRKHQWSAIRANGGRVYTLDEEGLFTFNEDVYMLRVGRNSINIADGLFLWGNRQKKYIEKCNLSAKKIHIVGNPRMDILGKNLVYFYESNKVNNIKKYGEYILVNVGFVLKSGNQSVIQTIEFHNEENIGEEMKSYLQKKYSNFRTLFTVFCDAIKKVSESINETIIVRPHPSETSFDEWVKSFEDRDNIVVIRTGDANSWIYGAKLVIHSGCTTSLEAYLSRKKCIIYNPIQEVNIPELSDLSIRAESPEALIDIVRKYLTENNDEDYFNEKRDNIIKEMVAIDSNEYSCEKIARIIESNGFFESNFRIRKVYDIRDLYLEFKLIKNALMKRKEEPKFGFTNTNEIHSIMDAANKMLKYNNRIKIKKINSNVFQISKVKNKI